MTCAQTGQTSPFSVVHLSVSIIIPSTVHLYRTQFKSSVSIFCSILILCNVRQCAQMKTEASTSHQQKVAFSRLSPDGSTCSGRQTTTYSSMHAALQCSQAILGYGRRTIRPEKGFTALSGVSSVFRPTLRIHLPAPCLWNAHLVTPQTGSHPETCNRQDVT